MRGASEFEVGAQRVCPQGTPITFMDGNEAHNNGKYGLRIFTGTNHNGEGLPGFYPRKVDSCAPVSERNPFEPAVFSNFFSWRNGMIGITGTWFCGMYRKGGLLAPSPLCAAQMGTMST